MQSTVRFLLIASVLAFMGVPRALAAQDKGPETILLTGASLGGVIFSHAAHQDMSDCTSCHHESRPEKPLEGEHQPCTACHVKAPVAPMTTTIRDAFHDAKASAGTCVDCHVTAETEGKQVPKKCTECHKKENVAPGS